MAHILKKVDGFQKRSDMFHVHPNSIIVVNGWNDRIDFSGEEELMESIKSVGVLEPLEVKKTKDNTIELSDGERRLRATLRANKEGADIQSIPVTVVSQKINEIDLYIRSLIRNTGKPLTPSEESNSFTRLIAWGYNIAKIAKIVGRSYAHVRNRLELSAAIPAVKKALDEKKITIKEAEEIISESDGKVDIQTKKLNEIKRIKRRPKKKEEKFSEWKFCQEIECKGYSFKYCKYLTENCPKKTKDFFDWMRKNDFK